MGDARAPAGDMTKKASVRNSVLDVLLVFLRLGLTSFGGPVAHLGFGASGEPGAVQSSQIGFALDVLHAGRPGGAAAWIGFTIPSAVIMLLADHGVGALAGGAGAGLLHGLKLVAVAVVAQAVWGMANSLCPDRPRATLAVLTTVFVLLLPSALTQIGVILLGASAGLALYRNADTGAPDAVLPLRVPRHAALSSLVLFVLLLAGLPLLAAMTGAHGVAVIDAFYRAGSLVFGGGHVVLPLLEQAMVPTGWISADGFLAGYGVVQAVPGPLFTFAAFLDAAQSMPPNGITGGLLALLAVFLPASF